ncbi:MAG: hypothetical protein AMXMBFR33_02070 [Candidatus Xenobia bacterium]
MEPSNRLEEILNALRWQAMRYPNRYPNLTLSQIAGRLGVSDEQLRLYRQGKHSICRIQGPLAILCAEYGLGQSLDMPNSTLTTVACREDDQAKHDWLPISRRFWELAPRRSRKTELVRTLEDLSHAKATSPPPRAGAGAEDGRTASPS